jgi:ketosteroid isomerase-like protein
MSSLDIVKGLYASFASKDAEGIARVMDPDIVWEQNAGFPGGGTWRGLASVSENVFARLRREFGGWVTEVREWIDAGDTVVAIGEYRGTNLATGRSFAAAFAHVLEVRGGRVVRFRQFTDTAMVRAAMPSEQDSRLAEA